MELGMGSVCRKKRGADKASPYEMFGAEKAEAIKSFNSDIILSRDSQGAHANVPHRIVRHSPDGFEWGYSGSGPSDLALNILSIYIGQAAAERGGLYQDFKDRFISPMPEQGGVIRREDILNWLKLKGEN
jgi:hypothetical protein